MPTLTRSIVVEGDDCTVAIHRINGTSAYATTLFAGYLGASGYDYYAHLLFSDIDIPDEAVISSAKLRLNKTAQSNEIGNYGAWRGVASDNVTQLPTQESPLQPNLRALFTQAAVAIDPAPLGVVEFDVTSIVKEIVGRPGWSRNNAMAFVSDTTGATQYVSFASFGDAGGPARLTIEYAVELTQEQRLIELAQAVGFDVKRLDAAIQAVSAGSGGGGSTPAARPMLVANHPTNQLLMSPWKRHGVGSVQYPSSASFYAVPIDCPGLEILGVSYHVQGGIPATACFMHFGIYNSDDMGVPAELIGQISQQVTTGGSKDLMLAAIIGAAAHKSRVWLCYSLWNSFQLSHSENSGIAGAEMGMLFSGDLNKGTSNGDHIVSQSLLGGTRESLSPTWPTTFGNWGISMNQTFPNIALRVRRPAP